LGEDSSASAVAMGLLIISYASLSFPACFSWRIITAVAFHKMYKAFRTSLEVNSIPTQLLLFRNTDPNPFLLNSYSFSEEHQP